MKHYSIDHAIKTKQGENHQQNQNKWGFEHIFEEQRWGFNRIL
jgi:hypothetical protein